MCKNSLCGVHDLQPLLERMVGTSKDHYPREGSYDIGPCLLIGLDFRGFHAVPVAISEGEFVNGGRYDNVPLHASFDQARVAHDRG
jgi:hypothetical protein